MNAELQLSDVLECLRKQREEARDRYGIEFVGVVGTVARGEVDLVDLKTVKPRLRAAMERDLVRA